jgi:HAE1 family hydrophobic/amphiphilic exporter-1
MRSLRTRITASATAGRKEVCARLNPDFGAVHGDDSRVGSPVFGGMIAAAVLGIFVIPMLYVVLQRMREWTVARTQETASRDASAPASSAGRTSAD